MVIACLVAAGSFVTCFAADGNTYSITVYKYGGSDGKNADVENPVNDAANVVSDSDFFGDSSNADGDVVKGSVPQNKYVSSVNKKPLEGAKFTLSLNQDGSSPINFVSAGGNCYTACFTENCTVHTHITEIETDSTGLFTLDGLPSGTYWLTEIKAPKEYTKLKEPIKITISSDGNITAEGENVSISDGMVKVLNKYGTELPGTGGIGFTIAYIICAIAALALAVLITVRFRINKRRRDLTKINAIQ